MIKNIIWDFDGTLFDTYPAIARAFQIVLEAHGKQASVEENEALSRVSMTYCLETLAERHSLQPDEIEQGFSDAYDKIRAVSSPPFEHVKTICEYIVSNQGKNVIITHRGKVGTEEILAQHDMTEYFSGWYTHQDGFPKKPDPTVFLHAIETFDLVPDETLNVGDRELDILAGQGAGLFSCMFRGEPGASQPEMRIDDYQVLYRYLLKQNGE